MPRAKQVKMTNGELEGYCVEESVEAWENNGWTRADDGSSEEEARVSEHPAETQVEETADPEDVSQAQKTTRKAK